jgi:hypothetical protein
METIIIGFPIISKLIRGHTVQLSNVALIPDDQLFNESKNIDCCVQFSEPTKNTKIFGINLEHDETALQPTNSISLQCPECGSSSCVYRSVVNDKKFKCTCCGNEWLAQV